MASSRDYSRRYCLDSRGWSLGGHAKNETAPGADLDALQGRCYLNQCLHVIPMLQAEALRFIGQDVFHPYEASDGLL